jgi:hypothetical protein
VDQGSTKAATGAKAALYLLLVLSLLLQPVLPRALRMRGSRGQIIEVVGGVGLEVAFILTPGVEWCGVYLVVFVLLPLRPTLYPHLLNRLSFTWPAKQLRHSHHHHRCYFSHFKHDFLAKEKMRVSQRLPN